MAISTIAPNVQLALALLIHANARDDLYRCGYDRGYEAGFIAAEVEARRRRHRVPPSRRVKP